MTIARHEQIGASGYRGSNDMIVVGVGIDHGRDDLAALPVKLRFT